MRNEREGIVLLEVLLSLALFIGTAAFVVGALHNSLNALERSRREALAVDLACSKMSELEAGLVTLADLEDPDRALMQVGSVKLDEDQRFITGSPEAHWAVEIRTQRTEFEDLTLVELTVREVEPGAARDRGISYTLRRLVALRGVRSEEYQEDEFLRGLMEGGQ